MMVKSAGKYGNTYAEVYSNFSKMTPEQRRAAIEEQVKALGPARDYFANMPAQDPDLKKLFPNKRPMSEGERFQAQEARRRQINRSRQQALGRQGAPAGRSIGSGYTGNEVRHGGVYATNPRDAPVGPRWQGDYRNLKSTQMMKKWMDAGNPASGGGVNSHKWKDYVANSKQNAASYTPNNPYQYTYAGSQSMDNQTTAGRYAQQNGVSGSEFGSDSDQGVEGSAYRGRVIPRTQGKIVERRVGAQVNPPPRPPAKVPTAAPAVQNARQPPPPPTPAPTPTNQQVQNPNMYEDVGMDEQNIADNWNRFVPNQPAQQPPPPPPPAPTPTSPQVQNPSMYEEVGMDEQSIADNWSRFVPNQPAQQPQTLPQSNPSISDGFNTLKDTFRN